MSHSKKEEERHWKQRKNNQHPHDDVKSFKKLGEEIAQITKKYDAE
jgi:hypothetical protein